MRIDDARRPGSSSVPNQYKDNKRQIRFSLLLILVRARRATRNSADCGGGFAFSSLFCSLKEETAFSTAKSTDKGRNLLNSNNALNSEPIESLSHFILFGADFLELIENSTISQAPTKWQTSIE